MKFNCRSSLKTLLSQPGFDELSEKTRIDILLDKATRYEQQLDDVRSVMSGERPARMPGRNFHYNAPSTIPQSCPETKFAGVHNAGTDRNCPSCAVYITKLVADTLSLPDTKH